MFNLFPLPLAAVIPSMQPDAIDRVRDMEAIASTKPQTDLNIRQFIHAGTYVRTATLPAGCMLTGALIKIPTVLVISGDCAVYTGDDFKRVQGYCVVACQPFRKQLFVAKSDTHLTMLFATDANDVKKAEEQFTDEWRFLTTRASHEV